jgi:hypothetical protein
MILPSWGVSEGAKTTFPTAINNRGEVAGYYDEGRSPLHFFEIHRSGSGDDDKATGT